MSRYETGTLHGHNWVKVPYNDVYKQEDPNAGDKFVIIISGPGKDHIADDLIDRRKTYGHGYTQFGLYQPFREEEIETIAGHARPIVLFEEFPKYYASLEDIDRMYPMPDDLKGAFDTHSQSKKLRINFRTTNRSGIEVSKPYVLDDKKFIENELKKAYEWGRKNAPKPTASKTMASTLTNAILHLADQEALDNFRKKDFENAAEASLTIPGGRFDSQAIDSVTFKKLKTANRVMTELTLGISTIVEDASGVTVTWHVSMPEGVIAGLAGKDLSEIMDADWAKGMKIRKAESDIIEVVKNHNDTTKHPAIKLRASIVYEEFDIPEKGREPDYAKELARHLVTFRAQGNKLTQELTWLLDRMTVKQRAIVFSQMIDPGNTYIRLAGIDLEGWIIERTYGARYHVSTAPEIAGDELNAYLDKIAA